MVDYWKFLIKDCVPGKESSDSNIVYVVIVSRGNNKDSKKSKNYFIIIIKNLLKFTCTYIIL